MTKIITVNELTIKCSTLQKEPAWKYNNNNSFRIVWVNWFQFKKWTSQYENKVQQYTKIS